MSNPATGALLPADHPHDGARSAVDRGRSGHDGPYVARASRTLRHLDWFELVEVRGVIDGDQVAHYQVTMKVGLRLEDPEER
jgi:flavin-binding protein dodecin